MIHVFIFGYETAIQLRNNNEHGWDDESSACFCIEAENELEAQRWGEEVAERFFQWLHGDESVSWRSSNYSRFVEPQTPQNSSCLITVLCGQFPDFSALIASPSYANQDAHK